MQMSFIVRLALAALIPLAAMIGYLFYGFVHYLNVQSPIIPCALFGALICMVWASMDLTDL